MLNYFPSSNLLFLVLGNIKFYPIVNFGTGTDKINIEIGSVKLELVNCFHFQVMPLERLGLHIKHCILTYATYICSS